MNGKCCITRAIGDFELKEFGMSAEPTVKKIPLDQNYGYAFVATDGIFDSLSVDSVNKIALGSSNSSEAARRIVSISELEGNTYKWYYI